jgi:23S rRNA (uracil1939-C5)-methyltransferase
MDSKIITIEKIVFGGKGLSRDLERITFVPFTLPGEKVRVQIRRERNDYQDADAIEIVEPDRDRVTPACPYFGVCGGCQMSHATYDRQVALKVSILQETLQRTGLRFPEIQMIQSKPFGYRHRAQLKYDATRRALGFYEMGSNRVVDIQECLCLTPGLNSVLKSVRSEVCTRTIPGLREIECYENDKQQTAVFYHPARPELPSSGPEEITISFRQHRFPMNPNIFLQVNPGLWRALIQEVESHYENLQLNHALELYCGAGFFTVALASRFNRMVACEENPEAIAFARKEHGLKNVFWICNKAETYRFPSDLDAVIVDPPRSGLPFHVIRQLLEKKPAWITYVSCDCPTFARDLRKLKEHYNIERLTLMDLFPQTYHFETVALLKRK